MRCSEKKPSGVRSWVPGRQPAVPVHFRGKFLSKKSRVWMWKFRGPPSYRSSTSLRPSSSRIVMRIFCNSSSYTVEHHSHCVRPEEEDADDDDDELGTASRLFRHSACGVWLARFNVMSINILGQWNVASSQTHLCPSTKILQRTSRLVSLGLLHVPSVRTYNFLQCRLRNAKESTVQLAFFVICEKKSFQS